MKSLLVTIACFYTISSFGQTIENNSEKHVYALPVDDLMVFKAGENLIEVFSAFIQHEKRRSHQVKGRSNMPIHSPESSHSTPIFQTDSTTVFSLIVLPPIDK